MVSGTQNIILKLIVISDIRKYLTHSFFKMKVNDSFLHLEAAEQKSFLSNWTSSVNWHSPKWTGNYYTQPVWKCWACESDRRTAIGVINVNWLWQMSPQLDSWQRNRDREEDRVQVRGKGQWDWCRQIKRGSWMRESVSVLDRLCAYVWFGVCRLIRWRRRRQKKMSIPVVLMRLFNNYWTWGKTEAEVLFSGVVSTGVFDCLCSVIRWWVLCNQLLFLLVFIDAF